MFLKVTKKLTEYIIATHTSIYDLSIYIYICANNACIGSLTVYVYIHAYVSGESETRGGCYE